jgi:hypothetical protein
MATLSHAKRLRLLSDTNSAPSAPWYMYLPVASGNEIPQTLTNSATSLP